jgi:hypothetical protein
MTTPKKPEWFELAQSDGGKPRTPVKSGARGVLLALPLMLIGAGVVVAQTADESPAVAKSITTAASAAPQVSAAITTAPAIATPPLPPKYADDDEEDEEDDRDDEDDDEEDDD